MANNNTSSSGIGLMGALFIVFLVLKLVNISVVATWSWWWVTLPLWGTFALVIVGIIIYAIIVGIASAWSKTKH